MYDFINDIKKDKLINKYMMETTWLSGSSTYVHPVTIWTDRKEVIIQLKTDKNLFNKLIQRYKEKYPALEYGYFWKSDGSCPCSLNFKFKEME